MTKKVESGKSRLIKGSMVYLWEEIKTMNMRKFKALCKIGAGYVQMKLFGPHKAKARPEIEQVQRNYAQ